jgi:hypothetical protein
MRCPRSAIAIHDDALLAALPSSALDDRIAIVGTAGSGKTYAAKDSSSDCSTAARAWQSWIRSACGGVCARAPTANIVIFWNLYTSSISMAGDLSRARHIGPGLSWSRIAEPIAAPAGETATTSFGRVEDQFTLCFCGSRVATRSAPNASSHIISNV